jgi:hypothetical protein
MTETETKDFIRSEKRGLALQFGCFEMLADSEISHHIWTTIKIYSVSVVPSCVGGKFRRPNNLNILSRKTSSAGSTL